MKSSIIEVLTTVLDWDLPEEGLAGAIEAHIGAYSD